jgi:hypothetical protein
MEVIDLDNLYRLAVLAEADEAALFARAPGGAGRYAGRILCRALCQGAALHFVDGVNGVKDFDVWLFYAALPIGPFPYRRIGDADFGPSKFGRWARDPERYVGRRIDFIGRSLLSDPGQDPTDTLRRYLSGGATESARALRTKAVVLIAPHGRVGEVVWPVRT